MKNLMREAGPVAEAFRAMTKAIDDTSPLDLRTKELILLGIFTAKRALRGIDTHVRIATQSGATRREIVAAIVYALPIVGITDVTLALGKALDVIGEISESDPTPRREASHGQD